MGNVQAVNAREAGYTRRKFYTAAIYGIGGLMAGALSIPALLYLFTPPRTRQREAWVPVGDAGKFEVNSPVEIAFRRNRTDGWKVISEKSTAWVVKRPDNSIVAYGPQCTHLGCAYHWEAEKKDFLCPCHTSVFAMDGTVISGPAPRPLDRYETRIEGQKLLLGELRRAGERSA
jgi:menaquinol-cytochrome c reductase iron-sulfur subunit